MDCFAGLITGGRSGSPSTRPTSGPTSVIITSKSHANRNKSPSTRPTSGAASVLIASKSYANRNESPSTRHTSGPARKAITSKAYANRPRREIYSSASRGDSKYARGDSSPGSRPITSDSDSEDSGNDDDDNRSTAKKKTKKKAKPKKKAQKPGSNKGKGGEEAKKEPEKELTGGQQFKVCCSSAFGIAVTMVLTSLYSVGGAYLFVHLERPYELQVRHDIGQYLNDTVDSLWNVTLKLHTLSEGEWRNSTKGELCRYQQIIYDATKAGWDGTSNPDDAPSWTIPSSLLYCLTIITTIGYGHITPKTDMGRYVTILYAIFGIPICVLMLSLIGDGLAASFRLFYKSLCNICFTGTTVGSGGGVRVPVLVSVGLIIGYIVLGAVLFSKVEENWTLSEAAYFCFITLSTIGFGDYVPGFGENQNNMNSITNGLYLLFGLSILAMCFNLMSEEVSEICGDIAGILTCKEKPGNGKPGTDINANAALLELIAFHGATRMRRRHQSGSPHSGNRKTVHVLTVSRRDDGGHHQSGDQIVRRPIRYEKIVGRCRGAEVSLRSEESDNCSEIINTRNSSRRKYGSRITDSSPRVNYSTRSGRIKSDISLRSSVAINSDHNKRICGKTQSDSNSSTDGETKSDSNDTTSPSLSGIESGLPVPCSLCGTGMADRIDHTSVDLGFDTNDADDDLSLPTREIHKTDSSTTSDPVRAVCSQPFRGAMFKAHTPCLFPNTLSLPSRLQSRAEFQSRVARTFNQRNQLLQPSCELSSAGCKKDRWKQGRHRQHGIDSSNDGEMLQFGVSKSLPTSSTILRLQEQQEKVAYATRLRRQQLSPQHWQLWSQQRLHQQGLRKRQPRQQTQHYKQRAQEKVRMVQQRTRLQQRQQQTQPKQPTQDLICCSSDSVPAQGFGNGTVTSSARSVADRPTVTSCARSMTDELTVTASALSTNAEDTRQVAPSMVKDTKGTDIVVLPV